MSRKTKLLIGAFAVVVMLISIWGTYKHISENFVYHDENHILVSTTGERMIAPDFTVFDIEREETTLSEHLGKKTVVSFWATWCTPCKLMLSNFNKVYKEMGNDVEFMMINLTDGMDETIEVASKYVKNSRLKVPVYYDLSYSAAHSYHVETLPLTIFIDENGYISNIHQGYLDKEQIEDYISSISNIQ